MIQNRNSAFSYLDAIRPDPGWETDIALVASYSSDLVVLVAVMLALAGLDDDRGSGSKVDFASAHEKLRDRLKFLLQGGRISVPKVRPTILGIMDRFIVEIKTDEFESSWHPKLFLIRYVYRVQNLVQWRLWMGSRNLTRDHSWDMGLLIIGSADHTDGDYLHGIAEAGEILFRLSGFRGRSSRSIRRELETVRWESPEGVTVKDVRLFHGKSPRGLPTPLADLQEILVVSPFLDGGTIRTLGSWGSTTTSRTLLSSREEINKLLVQKQKPTEKFKHLLFLDAPNLDEKENLYQQDEGEELLRGLHAKLICAKSDSTCRVWLGSANATTRAWQGANTEFVAEVDVDGKIHAWIKDFVNTGKVLDPTDISGEEVDPIQELLEDVRKSIAANWQAELVEHNGCPILRNLQPFHPGSEKVRLQIGLITSQLVDCPKGLTQLTLPAISPYEMTTLIRMRLSLEDQVCEWLQKASLKMTFPADRDQQAIAHYLTPRVFLEWIRSLLHPDVMTYGGEDWDDMEKPVPKTRSGSPHSTAWWAPSLEEVLKAWAKKPDTLKTVDRKLASYMKYIAGKHVDEDHKHEIEILSAFSRTWDIVRAELIGGKRHG